MCNTAPAALVVQGDALSHRGFQTPLRSVTVEDIRRRAHRAVISVDLDSTLLRPAQNSLLFNRSPSGDALRRAVEIGRAGVVREVIGSKLLGRGGAAFPTGRKWETVAQAPERPHYVVCNADESEPGTFKDLHLIEDCAFELVEAMAIAGFAGSCERGYFYVRGEYGLAASFLERAIARANDAGMLGNDILGSGFNFDIEVRRGAGAYICGEETALFNSIEGYRGEPRNKPPFPVQKGLFGMPTIVNNVETLANIPSIILHGGKAFAAIGTPESTGTRLFCLSGHVAQPGLYEVPFGMKLSALIDRAGGVRGGKKLQAVLLGGAAGTFLTPDELDVELSFEGVRAIKASLGSGVVMLFDETVDLRKIVARIARFFRDESCGQCVPCRIGTVRQEELLHRLAAGAENGSANDERRLLGEIGQAMRDASICGLGQTASSAIESALAKFNLYGGQAAQ
jgi:NADH-quinone oxidoreductase subunit F